MMTNGDAVDIAAQHRVIPNAGTFAQRHIAEDDRSARNINTRPKRRLFS